MPYSTIRDNHKNGTVGDFLKEAITSGSELSIVSAYFTIYAYAQPQLKDKLDSIQNLKFLFGEPTFIKSMDPDKNLKDYKIQDDKLVVPMESNLFQKSTAKECHDWLDNKAEIRSMVKPNFLHGKLYHVKQQSGIERAIAGSSNFTVGGLGLGNSKNIELNLVIDSDRERQELKDWFNLLWNDNTGLVEDVKEKVLKYLEQLYKENEPQFIYFKTLFHIFEDFLEEQRQGGLLNEKTGFFDSQVWDTLYKFQQDGVKGAINKILQYNGCIIADSVGLGKTYEALAVIKYFELLNANVLVICPKKLKQNWTIYQASQNHTLNPFKKDRFGYTLLYHTDMGRTSGYSDANGIDLSKVNWGAYDLVVIDESHNFRGNPAEKLTEDNEIKLNRAKWLMDKVVKSGVKTKVLLLSATPVNNTLKDLRNQVALITEGRTDALLEASDIKDIDQTLKVAQSHFTTWADKKNKNRTLKNLLERLDSSFFKLLDVLTIARSRKHITAFYSGSDIGTFPERNKPISTYPDIDIKDRFLSYDSLNQRILEYKLAVFNPTAYLKEGKAAEYEAQAKTKVGTFTQAKRESTLIQMMKVGFLKRLESSIESFEITLGRTIDKIEALEKKINKFQKAKLKSQVESFEELAPGEDESEDGSEEADDWEVGKKFKFKLEDIELDDWLEDLKKDKEALSDLYNNACAVTPDRDAKLKELQILIENKIKNHINKGNNKVVVFTAFADTAEYLYKNLEPWITRDLKLHCALVSGTSTRTTLGKNDYDNILTNFSPISKERDKLESNNIKEEIDILIATDCISEGQNLQDCDCLVNYDIHWNPVRIIQRFGRIDRLKSPNKVIQLVNFWPTKNLDNYINLKERVEARMALVDMTATGEDNLLTTEQIQDLISEDFKFRNKQLKKLQEEVLDLEDMDENISLTDFTLDDFRVELLNFMEENKKRLKDAPLGLYAVVPAPGGEHSDMIHGVELTSSHKEIIKPGVIFCLSQKEKFDGNEAVNPLNPYFLVYVRDDGTVRYNYTNAKQILEIFRLLCQNRVESYDKLCDLFNGETDNGKKMDTYTSMLQKAVSEIVQIYKKRTVAKLTSDRGALIQPVSKQVTEMKDFELITWLVLR